MTFFVFLLAAGFFNLSETAIIALDRVKLRQLAQNGGRRAASVEWLKDNPRHFFGFILLATNLAVVIVAAIGTHYLFFREHFVLATLVVDAIVLIFAEVTPKTLALRKPTRFAIAVGPVINVAAKMFGWIVLALTYIPAKLFKLDAGYALSGGDIITEMQIKTLAMIFMENQQKL